MRIVAYTLFPTLVNLAAWGQAVPLSTAKPQPLFLTCDKVNDRVKDFLKVHYSFRKFDTELSKRTFFKFFQSIDPGKSYFLESDIQSFKDYETKIGELIRKGNCQFISDAWDRFLQRLSESELYIAEALQKPFDFNVDEKIETDRKKILWAKDVATLKDRWAKSAKFNAMALRDAEPDPVKMVARLKKRYQLMHKTLVQRTKDDLHGLFLNDFALSLDPHSQFMMPQDQDDFKVTFSLQLVGIGASLSQQDGYTVVEALIPGGVAARDGRLKKGDKIIAVDSGDGSGITDVVDMDISKVVTLIRGKKDSIVKLTLLQKDIAGAVEQRVIELTRDIVVLADQEARSDVMEVRGKKIGVINLPAFYYDYQGKRSDKNFRSSANDMEREIKALKSKNVDGILVDLRRNGGGDLPECIKISGLFIDKGPVVQVQSRFGDADSLDDRDRGVAYAGPLGVLISRQSASASEIFAGAMQDYGRGLIIGDSRTYGKATVQSVMEIPGSNGRESDGGIKATISKFFRPSGKSNQIGGVESDVTVPSVLDATDLSEDENDYALPHNIIRPQRHFRQIQNLSAIRPVLQQRSEARVKGDKAFKETFDNIQKVKEEKLNTSISLKVVDKPKKDSVPRPEDATSVIPKGDVELRESAAVLVDSMEILGNKTDWTK